MDFNAIIDAELEALSDCSSEYQDLDEDQDVKLNNYDDTVSDELNSDGWVKLFLEKTTAQANKTKLLLNNALNNLDKGNEYGIHQISNITDEVKTEKKETENYLMHGTLIEETFSSELEIQNEEAAQGESITLNPDTSNNLQSEALPKVYSIDTKSVKDLEVRLIELENTFQHQKHESDLKAMELEEMFNTEVATKIDEIESNRLASHDKMEALEAVERNILLELDRQKQFYLSERQHKAACLIQSTYKGYCVRKIYQKELERRCRAVKQLLWEKRVAEIEKNRQIMEEETSLRIIQETASQDYSSVSTNQANAEISTEDSTQSNTSNTLVDKSIGDKDDSDGIINETPQLLDSNIKTKQDQNSVLQIPEHKPESYSTIEKIDRDLDLLASEEILPDNKLKTNSLLESFAQLHPTSRVDTKVTELNDFPVYEVEKQSFSVISAHEKVDNANVEDNILERQTSSCTINALEKDLIMLEKSINIDDQENASHNKTEDLAAHFKSESSQNFKESVYNEKLCQEHKTSSRTDVKPETKTLKINDNEISGEEKLSDLSHVQFTHVDVCKQIQFKKLEESTADHEVKGQHENIVEHLSSDKDNVTAHISYDALSDTLHDEIQIQPVPSKKNFNVSLLDIQASKDVSVQDKNSCDRDYYESKGRGVLYSKNEVKKVNVPSDNVTSKDMELHSQVVPVGNQLNNFERSLNSESTFSPKLENNSISMLCEQPDARQIPIVDGCKDGDSTPEKLYTELTIYSKESNVKKTSQHIQIPTESTQMLDAKVHYPVEEHNPELPKQQISSEIVLPEQELLIGLSKFPVSVNQSDDTLKNMLTPTQEELEQKYFSTENNFVDSLINWRTSCVKWNSARQLTTKLSDSMRRGPRRSSAAKRLPTIKETELLCGKWPFSTLSPATNLDSLSRVFIENLPDSNGRNLITVQRCTNITHLTLINCGLVSLEGLQACPSLRHINVSKNAINVISCDGMSRLQSLSASHNNLTSIHGLTGCTSLIYLDLSHNKITRLGGLEGLITLLHLKICNNQLIHIKSLNVCNTLMTLDVSSNNISSLQGIENCGLLRSLNAARNNISEINAAEFLNAILLVYFNLSHNSLSSLKVSQSTDGAPIWLPSLHTLDLSYNKLSNINITGVDNLLMSTPLLSSLDLSKNLISEIGDFYMVVCTILPCFRFLEMHGNLMSTAEERKVLSGAQGSKINVSFDEIQTKQETFKSLTSKALGFPNFEAMSYMEDNKNISKSAVSLFNTFSGITNLHHKEVRMLRGWPSQENFCGENVPPDMVCIHCGRLEELYQVSINQRHWFESGNPVEKFTIKCNKIEDKSRPKQQLVSTQSSCANTTFDNLQPDFVNPSQIPPEVDQTGEIKVCTELHETLSEEKHMERIDNVDKGQVKLTAKVDTSLQAGVSAKLVYQKLELQNSDKDVKCLAASKIQSYWRMYNSKRQYRSLFRKRTDASCLIQSAWRGFHVRRNVKAALMSIKMTFPLDPDPQNFDEVNLDELDFDEDEYDRQWALRTRLGHFMDPSTSIASKNELPERQDYPVANSHNFTTSSLRQDFGPITRPPLPPITPASSSGRRSPVIREVAPTSANSESSFVRETDPMLKHSAREARMADEWGLHSSHTAELMMKRAKRLKGRRKKEVTAGEKLKRFHEMSQRVPDQTPPLAPRKPSSTRNKMEYFKAREVAFEKNDQIPSEDEERRRQYTYEWLHTRANCQTPDTGGRQGHKPRGSPPSRPQVRSRDASMRSGFLPAISSRRSFVDNPLGGDMEVMSIGSYSSSNNPRNKNRLKDIARRHSGYDVS